MKHILLYGNVIEGQNNRTHKQYDCISRQELILKWEENSEETFTDEHQFIYINLESVVHNGNGETPHLDSTLLAEMCNYSNQHDIYVLMTSSGTKYSSMLDELMYYGGPLDGDMVMIIPR